MCCLLSVVSSFLELLTAQLLQSSSGAPSGLQLHILDVYMTELAAVGSAEVQKHTKKLVSVCHTLQNWKMKPRFHFKVRKEKSSTISFSLQLLKYETGSEASVWDLKLNIIVFCSELSFHFLQRSVRAKRFKKTLFCLCSCRLFNLIHSWTFIWLIVMMFCWCTDQLIRQSFFSMRRHVYSPVIWSSFFPLLSSLLIRTWHSSSRSAKQYRKLKSKSTTDQLLCFFYCDAVSKKCVEFII